MGPLTLSNGAVIDFTNLGADASLVFGGVIAVSVLIAGFIVIRSLVKKA